MPRHTMELGQRIFDVGYGREGVIVLRKVDGNYQYLAGYESNEALQDFKIFISDPNERAYITASGEVCYTWVNDDEVTEVGEPTIGRGLVVHHGFPEKRSFVAVWFVSGRDELFTASLHYNTEEDQFYTYNHGKDLFVPECDHGYSPAFFEQVGATFFVTGK